MGKSFPRFERGLRLELNDMIHAAETAVLETVGQLIDEFIIGYDQSGSMARNYIVRGFTVTNPSGSLLTIQNGVALLQYKHRGEMKAAVHLSGGDSSKTVDVGALTNGTYFVYVRWDLQDSDYQNRLALDPLASPAPAERVRHVPTRRTETWSATFGLSSPGDEWEPVASFDITAGAISGLTDVRNLYFEGEPSGGSYPLVPTTTDWGTADDRNNARGTYGLQGLRKFVRAIQQQLETLQGDGKKWWQTPTKTMDDKLNRDGTNTITGDIDAAPAGNHSLGLGGHFLSMLTEVLLANEVQPRTGTTVTVAGGDLDIDAGSLTASDEVVAGTFVEAGTFVRTGDTVPALGIGTHENCLFGPMIPKAVGRIDITAVGTPPTFSSSVYGCSVAAQNITYNGVTAYGFQVTLSLSITGGNIIVIPSYGNRGAAGVDSIDYSIEWEYVSGSMFNLLRMNNGSHIGWDAAADADWNDDSVTFVVFGPQ